MVHHDRTPTRQEEETQLGWRMAGLAFTMAAEAAAGALLGWAVDYFAGTAPKGLLIGSILGIVVGMWSLIKGAYAMNRLLSQQDLSRIKPLPPTPTSTDDDDHESDDWKDWNRTD